MGVAQSRRLAIAGCCHHRLGMDALLVDIHIVEQIGEAVVANALITREEVAVKLAAAQRDHIDPRRGQRIPWHQYL